MARLRRRVRTATAATRPALERELAAAGNRLELNRVQLHFATKLQGFEAVVPKDEADLSRQIQALQDAVPDLGATRATPAIVSTPPPSSGSTAGTWALLHRLLALQHTRSSLVALTSATDGMVRSTSAEVLGMQQRVRPLAARLRALAQDPSANGTTLAAGEREFHDLLERGKLLGAVRLPLREESALLHRYATDVHRWTRAVDGEIGHVLRGLALEGLGVAIMLAVVGVGSLLWRFAVGRYVTSAYHRRLLLGARRVVVLTAIVLVLVFHFTSELTALVAALGFAAAGIALALQNVILAVAGYVSIMAPNGIRAGDRVSLQGPFGYVHGEVIEIGVVRTRLQELAGEPLQPTGRIVVFPNSVVFTGSFFKHPPPEARRSQVASEPGDLRGQR
jgi:small-conductance mechanosensitive channel